MTLQVFKYIEQLDAFLIEDEFQKVAEELGLVEWHAVVWMGRLFTLDSDYGEHWFDNWNAREDKEEAAQELGIDSEKLMILYDDCFSTEWDGPCHSREVRKAFWTQVLKSIKMEPQFLFQLAREENQKIIERPDCHLPDLEERIERLCQKFDIEYSK